MKRGQESPELAPGKGETLCTHQQGIIPGCPSPSALCGNGCHHIECSSHHLGQVCVDMPGNQTAWLQVREETVEAENRNTENSTCFRGVNV